MTRWAGRHATWKAATTLDHVARRPAVFLEGAARGRWLGGRCFWPLKGRVEFAPAGPEKMEICKVAPPQRAACIAPASRCGRPRQPPAPQERKRRAGRDFKLVAASGRRAPPRTPSDFDRSSYISHFLGSTRPLALHDGSGRRRPRRPKRPRARRGRHAARSSASASARRPPAPRPARRLGQGRLPST